MVSIWNVNQGSYFAPGKIWARQQKCTQSVHARPQALLEMIDRTDKLIEFPFFVCMGKKGRISIAG
jgi:hypothetical protein